MDRPVTAQFLKLLVSSPLVLRVPGEEPPLTGLQWSIQNRSEGDGQ